MIRRVTFRVVYYRVQSGTAERKAVYVWTLTTYAFTHAIGTAFIGQIWSPCPSADEPLPLRNLQSTVTELLGRYEVGRKEGKYSEEEAKREHAKHSLERYMHYFQR